MTVEEKLDLVLARLADVLRRLPPAVATAAQLDGKGGDREARFDPKAWKGSSRKGRQWSQCEPEFLDALAEALQFFADNPKPDADPKKSEWDRKDAALIRGWAQRKRSGWKPAAASKDALWGPPAEDDVSF